MNLSSLCRDISLALFLTLFIVSNVLSNVETDTAITSFQKREYRKKSQNATFMIVSGGLCIVGGVLMIASWKSDSAKFHKVVITDQDTSIQEFEKPPTKAVFGGLLSAIGISLDVTGIIQKVKLRKEQRTSDIAERKKYYLTLKQSGAEFTMKF